MTKNSFHLFASLLLIFSINLNAQDMGGNPTGLNWQILGSPSVRVIYPKGMEIQAQRIAGLINYLDSNTRQSIGPKKHRLDLVLQNQTVNPNGYVGLAPFRSEFYATPPASNNLLGSMNWLDALTIHEYRHALQFMNSLQGFTKAFYYLQGERIWTILNAISIPNWYFEGDAVIMETALSSCGRGRASFFTMEQRALAYENKNYSYLQNRNGSYKKMIPDHYRLGYMMLTKIRNEKGNNITSKILRDASAYKGIFYPFSRALKKSTGYSTKTLYAQAWEDKKIEFKKQLINVNSPTTSVTQKNNTTYTSYRFPCALENGDIVVRKGSFKITDEIVKLSNGKEEKLTTIGFNNDDILHYSNGTLAWTELAIDSRRANKDYSNIVTYNLNTHKKIYLTKKERYFSPSISPDGKLIASIHISPEQQNEIHIIDILSKAVVKKIKTPLNYFLSRIAWNNDGNSIVTVAKQNSKVALIKINIQNTEIQELTDWTSHTMDAPAIMDNKVYFNAGYTGIDNIFCTDLAGSKKIYQVTSVPVGAFDPRPTQNNEILFTEFTYMGYVISKQSLNNQNQNKIIEVVEPSEMEIFKTTANISEGGNILDKNYASNYTSKPYNGLFRGVKLHSWNISPSISNPGVSIDMINLLRDISLQLGGNINKNEGNSISYVGKLIIARYFPQLSFTAKQAKRQTEFYSNADTLSKQTFSETTLGAEISIPLAWLKGNFSYKFVPELGVSYNSFNSINEEGNNIATKNFSNTHFGISFSSKRRRALQNVGTRLGVELKTKYYTALNSISANKTEALARVFLPGFAPNHNFTISASYQKEKLTNLYQYADVFEYSRGFTSPINDEFKLIKAEYQLPLLYPDYGALGITYFKRIRANFYYDYGIGENIKMKKSTVYNSAGVELIFDNTVLNFLPLSFGLRKSYLINSDPLLAKSKSGFSFFIFTDL
jgi:hypothetical protein